MIGDPLAMIRKTARGIVSRQVTLDREGCQRVVAALDAQERIVTAARIVVDAQNNLSSYAVDDAIDDLEGALDAANVAPEGE